MTIVLVESEDQMEKIAVEFGHHLSIGDIVLLIGPLGAGKTTFVRGYLHSIGISEPVRSPTFNILQTFPTHPPTLHADLYRLKSLENLGLEEYLDDHICLIEWADQFPEFFKNLPHWTVNIAMAEHGRVVEILNPDQESWNPSAILNS